MLKVTQPGNGKARAPLPASDSVLPEASQFPWTRKAGQGHRDPLPRFTDEDGKEVQ